MALHHLAGKSAPRELLINTPRVVASYYALTPNVENQPEQVAFGTSGHRGSSTLCSFNENHILAICQAICEYRATHSISGPLFLGMDTHALSEPAFMSAIEVFSANGVDVRIQQGLGYTPTPVISHAIITYNRNKTAHLADGVVITPSHNPPADGGIKYNPPHGGPADTEVTKQIESRANEILSHALRDVKRLPYARAIRCAFVKEFDYITPYVADLGSVVDMRIIAERGIKIGVDPLGGAAVAYWEPIARKYGINLQVLNPVVDPTFSFMTVDKDGKIRMDCSSPYAMASLIKNKDQFDLSFGNDPDVDRHGIVTRTHGLMNPNHYLSVAIWYLFQNRPEWKKTAAIGKTLVSSSMIDRVAENLGRKLEEVPVGFKWFVEGLSHGDYGFGGEESAGASFLRRDGSVWTTDKDGIILNLLAAEITARTEKDPAIIYKSLEDQFGSAVYERKDAPATPAQKKLLSSLNTESVKARELAGEPIVAKLTKAPGNQAPLGGLKVVTQNGWFAARPSGTEDVYKIYAESFKGKEHLNQIFEEAQKIVSAAFSES